MQNSKITYASKTKYNNIYKTTNWGNFQYLQGVDEDYNNMVIQNRNSFILDYDIKKHVSTPSNILINFRHALQSSKTMDIDHVEIYILNNGKYLFVNNPYSSTEESKMRLNDGGWVEIYNLYIIGSKTYVKTYDKYEISDFMKKYKRDAKKKKNGL